MPATQIPLIIRSSVPIFMKLSTFSTSELALKDYLGSLMKLSIDILILFYYLVFVVYFHSGDSLWRNRS